MCCLSTSGAAMNTADIFPKTTWVDLRMFIEQDGQIKSKLMARFDPVRGVLQVCERQQQHTFDLTQIIAEYQVKQK